MNFQEQLNALAARVKAIEERMAALANTGNVAMMVRDKELDRVIEEMRTIKHTYSEHQNWAQRDVARFKQLKARKAELKAILGVKV